MRMMLRPDLVLPVHPRAQALGDGDGHVFLVPAVLEQGGENAGHGEGGAVDGPRVDEAAAVGGAGAGGEAAGLVVAADAGARDLAPAIVLLRPRREVRLDVALAAGRSPQVRRRHLQHPAPQAQRRQDLRLDVEHLVEDLGGRR